MATAQPISQSSLAAMYDGLWSIRAGVMLAHCWLINRIIRGRPSGTSTL
jgi:hypothetical protein